MELSTIFDKWFTKFDNITKMIKNSYFFQIKNLQIALEKYEQFSQDILQ